MAAPMVRTACPGVFSRGSRFVATYRDADGRQRSESCASLAEAMRLKRQREDEITPQRATRRAERMRERREIEREIARARTASLAESRRSAAEAYALVRRALQAVEAADAAAVHRDARARYREAFPALYRAEDAVGAGMRADRA